MSLRPPGSLTERARNPHSPTRHLAPSGSPSAPFLISTGNVKSGKRTGAVDLLSKMDSIFQTAVEVGPSFSRSRAALESSSCNSVRRGPDRT